MSNYQPPTTTWNFQLNLFTICAWMLVCFSSMVFINCSEEKSKPVISEEQQEIINAINRHRAEKDSVFLHSAHSPLLEDDRKSFTGLKYFPIDLSLRFEGPIHKYDSTILNTIWGSKGDIRPAQKYGYFSFEYNSQTYRLQIYKILRDDPELQKYLFLGFTDQTSGIETYGGGRYIDLVENPDNFYVVDFNLAYNPYCAYNERYSCAIPPGENFLPFRVKAGEKIYKKHP